MDLLIFLKKSEVKKHREAELSGVRDPTSSKRTRTVKLEQPLFSGPSGYLAPRKLFILILRMLSQGLGFRAGYS